MNKEVEKLVCENLVLEEILDNIEMIFWDNYIVNEQNIDNDRVRFLLGKEIQKRNRK